MDTAARPRPKHRGTWFVIIVGLIEIAAIVAFFELKGVAGAVCGASGFAQVSGRGGSGMAGGGMQIPMGGGAAAMPSADAGGAGQPLVAGSSAAPAAVSSAQGTDTTAAGGDASVKGDTNQVVDPKCVGKTAASLLNSDSPAPGPTATCAPMQQPQALKDAEKQISH